MWQCLCSQVLLKVCCCCCCCGELRLPIGQEKCGNVSDGQLQAGASSIISLLSSCLQCWHDRLWKPVLLLVLLLLLLLLLL
jgi:hypothetical protein